jgi:small subunit ribosomal protein S20
LANTIQAKKRARQAEKHRKNNVSQRSEFRTNLKKVVSAITTGKKDNAKSAFQNAVSVIDSMVSKGLIHKNKAARHKSRLSAQVKGLTA